MTVTRAASAEGNSRSVYSGGSSITSWTSAKARTSSISVCLIIWAEELLAVGPAARPPDDDMDELPAPIWLAKSSMLELGREVPSPAGKLLAAGWYERAPGWLEGAKWTEAVWYRNGLLGGAWPVDEPSTLELRREACLGSNGEGGLLIVKLLADIWCGRAGIRLLTE